jgi:hypothetical protein
MKKTPLAYAAAIVFFGGTHGLPVYLHPFQKKERANSLKINNNVRYR